MRYALAHYCLALLCAPFLLGIINRVKAWFGGRQGKPLLQAYWDILKLLGKGAVYSRTTTWVFRAGPMVSLASMLAALALVPLGGGMSVLTFPGDIFLFAYFLGLSRFFTVAAAMDTGSSFEGMGSSREVTFSALVEPVLFLSLLALGRQSGSLSLASMLSTISAQTWLQAAPALTLVSASLFLVLLVENSRIPIDDPNTHLELTMIHEVMVLDHSGPDLAFIQYAAALKLWLLGSLLAGIVSPAVTGSLLLDTAAGLGTILCLAVAVGVVESIMARLRLVRIPQLLASAGAFSALAIILLGR